MRALVLICCLAASSALANAAGVVGYSGKPPAADCNGCHNGGGAPTVSITGPTTLTAGQSATYTLNVSGNSFGANIAVEPAQASLNPIGTTMAVAFGELHQRARINGNSVQFSVTAPPFAGTMTIYGTGNAVNGDGNTGGDTSRAATLAVTVSAGSGANAPVITTPAAATPATATGSTVDLSVTAADDGPGEPGLSYTWSSTGPAPVTFTPNGSNAAKASKATFSTDGTYVLTVTIRDSLNMSTTGTVNLMVVPTYSFLRQTPVVASVAPGQKQQFTASQRDQFDRVLAVQQPVTWMVPFGGTVDMNGLFTAQNGPTMGVVVQSNAAGRSAASTVNIGSAAPTSSDTTPPTVSLVLPAVPLTPLTTVTVLEAVAADNGASDTGVASVSFEVAQIRIGTVTNGPPWKMNFVQVAGLPGGPQPLEAVARDNAGNVQRSPALTVTVTASGSGGGSGGGSGTGGGAGGSGGSGGSGGAGGGGGGGGCQCGALAGGPLSFALLGLASAFARRRRR